MSDWRSAFEGCRVGTVPKAGADGAMGGGDMSFAVATEGSRVACSDLAMATSRALSGSSSRSLRGSR